MGINSIGNNSGYKGTAFGDPAETATVNKPKPATNSNPAETTIINSSQSAAKSYPVDFKGTAFGEPAVVAKTNTPNAVYTVEAGTGVPRKNVHLAALQANGYFVDMKL
jgi:hypothetical protein